MIRRRTIKKLTLMKCGSKCRLELVDGSKVEVANHLFCVPDMEDTMRFLGHDQLTGIFEELVPFVILEDPNNADFNQLFDFSYYRVLFYFSKYCVVQND